MRKRNLGLIPAAAVVAALAVATAPVHAAAPRADTVAHEVAWLRAYRQQMVVQEGTYHAVYARQIHQDAVVRSGRASLSPVLSAAHDELAGSAGKASEGARVALSESLQHSNLVLDRADVEGAFTAAVADLNTQRGVVATEVAAWEAAEAARVAAEAEAARVAAAKAAQAKTASPRVQKAVASGQTPQQYLDSLAARYGTSIHWEEQACGHGGGSRMAGCYYFGDPFVTVTNSARASGSAATGLGDNVVLHEVAHFLSVFRCGDDVGIDRMENVPDAISVLLGGGTGGWRRGAGRVTDFDACQYLHMSMSAMSVRDAALGYCTPLAREPITADQAEGASRMLKALADQVRLRLMSMVLSHEGGEACAMCDRTEGFDLSQSTLSHHLKGRASRSIRTCVSASRQRTRRPSRRLSTTPEARSSRIVWDTDASGTCTAAEISHTQSSTASSSA